MRVNLITQPSSRGSRTQGKATLSLTIRPACGLPGEYQFPTTSHALMRLLRKETSLPAPVLDRFEGKLESPAGARLLGVELGEATLTRICYFID